MIFDFSFLLVLIQSFSAWFWSFWWLWVFLALVLIAPQVWLAYVQEYFRRSIPYVVLELRLPREVRKSPRAMEQVFTNIHSLKNSQDNFQEKWYDGEVPNTFSFEMASFGGEIHFFVRVPQRHKKIIEAGFYSQYQDIEITEVPDYVSRFPSTYRGIDEKGYNIFGNELVLSKEDVYPIRTYVDYEAVDEIKEVDPISGILEVLAAIKPQEELWLQLVCQPRVDDQIPEWVKKGETVVDDIKGKSQQKVNPVTGEVLFRFPSPGETEAMKAIDRTISKPAFFTVIRYIYFSPKEIFSSNFGQRGLFAAFNHYATETFNKFRYNVTVWTRANIWYWPHLFPKHRNRVRKERVVARYRRRAVYDDIFFAQLLDLNVFDWGLGTYNNARYKRITLNTEELATLYHPPTYLVLTGPMTKRVESRRMGPPAGMEIYGSEEDEKLPGVS